MGKAELGSGHHCKEDPGMAKGVARRALDFIRVFLVCKRAHVRRPSDLFFFVGSLSVQRSSRASLKAAKFGVAKASAEAGLALKKM